MSGTSRLQPRRPHRQKSTSRNCCTTSLNRSASASSFRKWKSSLPLASLRQGVAHDFNNTLAGILGRAQLLQRTDDLEKVKRGLDIIIKTAEDGAKTVKRIRTLRDSGGIKTLNSFQSIRSCWTRARSLARVGKIARNVKHSHLARPADRIQRNGHG